MSLIFTAVQLIYNAALVSGAQQSISIMRQISDIWIRIYISTLLEIIFPCKSLQSIKQSSLCCTVGPYYFIHSGAAQQVKRLPAMQGTQETQAQSLGGEDPLQEEMAIHPSILAWKIPQTEEPRGLQSMEQRRAVHD